MKKFLFCILLLFITLSADLSIAADEETLIIFDASVSMLENFSGQPKYITAVEEAKTVLDAMDASKSIGLRTIGVPLDVSILSFIQNPAEMCKATRLETPISANNIQAVKSALDRVFPLGTTPLTYALNTAVNYDFSPYAALKHIILVTDGAESCNGDPCKYIRELMQTRRDIKIDIIAIGVNSEDFMQLKCLADSTTGSIINAQNKKELKNAFDSFLKPEFSSKLQPVYRNSNSQNSDIIYRNYMFETYK